MAPSVARAAVAAAALPSGRAHRLGSGRLSLAALPGHGALGFPGRRDRTGRGGVLGVAFTAAVSAFRLAMEVLKVSQRSIAFVGSPTDILLQGTFNTAKDCIVMVEFLLVKAPVHQDIVKELIPAGEAFLIVESQAKEGYVKAETLVNAIQSLKLVGKTFFRDAKLPEYSAPAVPSSSDDLDRDSFFKELINLFVVFYIALYWEARKKYGFGMGGAI